VELGQGGSTCDGSRNIIKLLSGRSPFEWPFLGLVVASNGGLLVLFKQPWRLYQSKWVPMAASNTVSGEFRLVHNNWGKFLSKYSDFSYNLVVKKVKSNDRQFTGANMTCFYSFHSNFGGKFLFALFFIFQVFQRFHWRCMRSQHIFIGVCRQSWKKWSLPDT